MMPLREAFTSLAGVLVFILLFIVLVGQLAVIILCIMERRGTGRMLRTIFHFALGSIISSLMLHSVFREEFYLREMEPITRYGFESFFLSMPWAVYLILEIISGIIIILEIREIIRYRRSHLSQNSIREALNLLPAGVLIGAKDGTVLLVNSIMDNIGRKLTGSPLTSTLKFWDSVEASGEESDGSYLITLSDGSAWMLTRDEWNADGEDRVQIIASDMTDQYRATEELRSKNRDLREVQYRMKIVSAEESALISEREIMKARTTVHNQMGNVLLMGKYYMDNPDSIDEDELLKLLEFNNYFLIREAETPDIKEDQYKEALNKALRIGVRTEIIGDVPDKGPARELIARAIDQCSANTARHAGGDTLYVNISSEEEKNVIRISNNGDVPYGPIRETGGLADLRLHVEEAGGSMEINETPRFMLTIRI